jgi:uncharacterized protein YndB with AHSA1/START domain
MAVPFHVRGPPPSPGIQSPRMGPVSATISIDAPREEVFEVVADLARRPAFCDHFIDEYRLQRLESTGVGAAARFRTDAPRFGIWMESVIDRLEPPHLLVERGRGARADRMPIGIAWELVEAAGATTEVTVSFWTEPSNPFDRLRERLGSGRWYRRQWKRALVRLRDLVESGEPIDRLRVAGASRA